MTEKVKKFDLAKILAGVSTVAAAAAVQQNLPELKVKSAKIHEIAFSGGTIHRLGWVFDSNQGLFVSAKIEKIGEGDQALYVPYADYANVPRNGEPSPGEASHLWLRCPGKPEEKPVAIAGGIPMPRDTSVYTGIVSLLDQVNKDKDLEEFLREQGMIYSRKFGEKVTEAICIPLDSLSDPEMTLLGSRGESGNVAFKINPKVGQGQAQSRDMAQNLCWGKRPPWGIWESESQRPNVQPHRLEGTAVSQGAAECLQNVADKAMKLAGGKAPKSGLVTRTATRGAFMEKFYGKAAEKQLVGDDAKQEEISIPQV